MRNSVNKKFIQIGVPIKLYVTQPSHQREFCYSFPFKGIKHIIQREYKH